MSVIRYLYRNFDSASQEQQFSELEYDENRLLRKPGAHYYENVVSYTNSESRHLRSFECAFSNPSPGYSLLNRQYGGFHILYVADGVAY